MIVQRSLDTGYCLSILTNPEIFDAISEDGATVEHLNVDVIKDYWVEIIDDDVEIGVIQFKQMFHKCWDIHIHILPEHRKQYSMEAGDKIWSWIMDNLKGSLLCTSIPVFCPNVRDFALSFGFKETGYLEKAWLKHGKQNDMWLMSKRVE